MIERPFGEGETGIEPLRVTIDQVVERGHVDLLDLVRLVGVPLGVVARFQRVVERTVGRHVGPQLPVLFSVRNECDHDDDASLSVSSSSR